MSPGSASPRTVNTSKPARDAWAPLCLHKHTQRAPCAPHSLCPHTTPRLLHIMQHCPPQEKTILGKLKQWKWKNCEKMHSCPSGIKEKFKPWFDLWEMCSLIQAGKRWADRTEVAKVKLPTGEAAADRQSTVSSSPVDRGNKWGTAHANQ